MKLDVLDSKENLKTLKAELHRDSAPAAAELIERLPDGDIQCFACGHRCVVKPGRDGVCRVRFNEANELHVPFGYVGALACDPIEKKPFFHFLPGTDVLTFGMLGCDYHCGYCQNWVTSQMLRDPRAVAPLKRISAEALVERAVARGAPTIASSYNEPLITTEWAVTVFKQAAERGLKCAYVSNGNATPQVLDFLRPHVQAYKVDLKGFDDRRYRQLGGVLANVTATIRMLKDRDFWIEIVTLIVPGFNDDLDELRRMTDFLASVDPLIPWHVTAFHPDYKMTDGNRHTTAEELLEIADIGRNAGLKFIYQGNLPGQVGEGENTRCHQCKTTLIARHGFTVTKNRLDATGCCPSCGERIPGVWK